MKNRRLFAYGGIGTVPAGRSASTAVAHVHENKLSSIHCITYLQQRASGPRRFTLGVKRLSYTDRRPIGRQFCVMSHCNGNLLSKELVPTAQVPSVLQRVHSCPASNFSTTLSDSTHGRSLRLPRPFCPRLVVTQSPASADDIH